MEFRVMKEFGLNSKWVPIDRKEVLAYNRILWQKWKEENGFNLYTRVKDIPGFLDSIQELHLYGYSLTDIGSFFGLSRQRIEQIFKKQGLERIDKHGAMYRVWNDEENCFIPVVDKDLEALLRETSKKKLGKN